MWNKPMMPLPAPVEVAPLETPTERQLEYVENMLSFYRAQLRPPTLRELAEKMGVTKSAVSGVVCLLRKKGFIREDALIPHKCQQAMGQHGVYLFWGSNGNASRG